MSRSRSLTASRGGQRLFPHRRPYEIWGSKSPAQVSAELSVVLGPEWISPMETVARSGEHGARERSLVITGRDQSSNPWRFVFRGSMRPGAGGTCLTGAVGPSSAVLVIVLGWMSVVTVFLVSGVVAAVAGAISGQRTPILPWLLIPAVVLTASYAVHRAATTAAAIRWRATDEWLRDLVNVHASP